MVIAVAALLFQILPATLDQTSPIGNEVGASTPTLFAMSLPDSPASIASVAVVPTAAAAQPSSSGPVAKSGERNASSSAPDDTENMKPGIENSESLALIRVPEKSVRDNHFISPEVLPSRRRWIALAVAQHAAAAFDAYTTRDAISRGAVEQDPLMRPFANSSGMYAAIQVAPVVIDLAARRMQRSGNNFLRHTWWVPQSISTGMFLFSGAHNLQVVGLR